MLPAYVRIRTEGAVLRASISVLVIGFALAGLIGSATAQYPPPQPPPLGYPPPAPYSYPAGPPRYPGAYPYGDAEVPYEDPDDQLYSPDSGPPASYPPPTSDSYPASRPRYPVYPLTDVLSARPGEALAADADAVAHCFSAA